MKIQLNKNNFENFIGEFDCFFTNQALKKVKFDFWKNNKKILENNSKRIVKRVKLIFMNVLNVRNYDYKY